MSHWSERQQAMLREMGVRLWLPPDEVSDTPAAVLVPAASEEASRPSSTDAAVSRPTRSHAPPTPSPVVASRGEMAPAAVASPAKRAWPESPGGLSGSDVAHLDWDALQVQVEQCQACALARSRHQAVFGVGHRQAHWMLVGEAPGEQEDLRGEPFVGKAGQLLDNMLRAVGLTRSDAPPEQQVYIANVLKCRPPGNRNPDPAEVQQCVPYLQRQIALVRPRLILALGRFAVQSLLGTAEPIGRLRGKVHQHQGIPVVVSYHPAYLLRNPLDKARTWEDLCLAAAVYRRQPDR